jgi:hypothetical protein
VQVVIARSIQLRDVTISRVTDSKVRKNLKQYNTYSFATIFSANRTQPATPGVLFSSDIAPPAIFPVYSPGQATRARLAWRDIFEEGGMLFKMIAAATTACILIAAASVLYRLQKAKPIMMIDGPVFRFSETWCSGRSNRNALARLAFAKKFVWVAVTNSELHVSPHFPFSLMFLPGAFGLDHRVKGRQIIDVQQVYSRYSGWCTREISPCHGRRGKPRAMRN